MHCQNNLCSPKSKNLWTLLFNFCPAIINSLLYMVYIDTVYTLPIHCYNFVHLLEMHTVKRCTKKSKYTSGMIDVYSASLHRLDGNIFVVFTRTLSIGKISLICCRYTILYSLVTLVRTSIMLLGTDERLV